MTEQKFYSSDLEQTEFDLSDEQPNLRIHIDRSSRTITYIDTLLGSSFVVNFDAADRVDGIHHPAQVFPRSQCSNAISETVSKMDLESELKLAAKAGFKPVDSETEDFYLSL